jgi:hypothetical protein
VSFKNNGLDDVVRVVIAFMESALDTESAVITGDARVYHQNLLSGFKHAHANHSLRVWLSLLDAVRSTMTECFTHLNDLLEVVRNNALELVMDCQGVRIVNMLFLEFSEHHVVGHLLDVFLGDPDMLLLLVLHEFANHAIQLAMLLDQERIFRAVAWHLDAVAPHKFGSHVASTCMKIASRAWLPIFTDAYIKHKHKLAAEPKFSRFVRTALVNSLTKNGQPELVFKLDESLRCLPVLLPKKR